jgi:hypothetical protein
MVVRHSPFSPDICVIVNRSVEDDKGYIPDLGDLNQKGQEMNAWTVRLIP